MLSVIMVQMTSSKSLVISVIINLFISEFLKADYFYEPIVQMHHVVTSDGTNRKYWGNGHFNGVMSVTYDSITSCLSPLNCDSSVPLSKREYHRVCFAKTMPTMANYKGEA